MKLTVEFIEIFQHDLRPWRGMALKARMALVKIKQLERERLSSKNYSEYFSLILKAEEFAMEMRMDLYDMFGVELRYVRDQLKNCNYFRLNVPGINFINSLRAPFLFWQLFSN